jgi:nucleoside-diphosphate-sugar epimerase
MQTVQYVNYLMEGTFRLMRHPETRPANVGNFVEMTLDLSGSESELIHGPIPEVDPERRSPNVARIGNALGWEPRVPAHKEPKMTLERLAERVFEVS